MSAATVSAAVVSTAVVSVVSAVASVAAVLLPQDAKEIAAIATTSKLISSFSLLFKSVKQSFVY